MATSAATLLGIMSGTSTDGLDMALCRFTPNGPEGYHFSFLKTDFFPYSEEEKERLQDNYHASGHAMTQNDVWFGKLIGRKVNEFLQDAPEKPLAIASHGHTVFHNPQEGYSHQIGNGAWIYALTGLPVVNSFRILDIARGGQGAPLVPIGDQLLFGQYSACLNLGGFANISFENPQGQRVAGDVCFSNLVLNYLSSKLGYAYDEDGQNARQGKYLQDVALDLDQEPYFRKPFPKSLGREWLEENIWPLLDNPEHRVIDLLHTATVFLATKIAESLPQGASKVLVTGGGAQNQFLVQQLRKKSPKSVEFQVPDEQLLKYKEALIFAFLGYLRLGGEGNTLATVTGASQDSSSGVFWGETPLLQ